MKKKIIILLVVSILSVFYYFGFIFIYSSAYNDFMKQQLKSAQYQSMLLSRILSDQLESGASKEEVISNLQQALEDTPSDPVFVCMLNSYGKEICHPDRVKIGTIITNDDSTIKSFSNTDLEENFKMVLKKKVSYGGIHKIKEGNRVEVIYLSPVKGTDWIIATHCNLAAMDETLSVIKTKLILFFVLAWLCSVTLILFLIFILYNRYSNDATANNIELKNQGNEKDPDFVVKQEDDQEERKANHSSKRFLAEKGLKLIPVEKDNIAFIYLENRVVYVVDFNGTKSTLNMSLEEIYDSLPKDQFFRISRQIILSSKSIQTIEKYGMVQLRAITVPVSDIPIIISKAKVSEFKSWIGKN